MTVGTMMIGFHQQVAVEWAIKLSIINLLTNITIMNEKKSHYVSPRTHIADSIITYGFMSVSQYADVEEGNNNFDNDGIYGSTEGLEKDDSWDMGYDNGYD